MNPPQPSGPPQVELTDIQKGDLARIWTNHSPYPDDSCSSSSSAQQEEVLDDNTYRHVTRLHSFVLALAVEAMAETAEQDSTTRHAATYGQKKVIEQIVSSLFYGTNRPSNAAMLRLTERRRVAFFPYAPFHDAFHAHEEQRAGQPLSQDYNQRFSYAAFLYHRPEKALSALGSALALCMATLWRRQHCSQFQEPLHKNQQQKVLIRALEECNFVVRFLDADRTSLMGDIKTSLNNKLIAIKGYVVKAKPKRLRVTKADFRCCRCGEQFVWKLFDGKYNVPNRCVATQCRSKTFTIIRSTAKYVGFQELKLQEIQEETVTINGSSDAGRAPRQIEVEVTDDLVDTCATGDIVKVVGIVKSLSTALAAGRTGRQALETSTYKFYIKANSITNTSSESHSERGSANKKLKKKNSAQKISFSASQLENIRKIAHADHRIGTMKMRQSFPFDLLVHSLCPSIVGHELVKAGLLLILLGGTPPSASGLDAQSCNTIRSNSHMLIVG